jgi:hypothetical protein
MSIQGTSRVQVALSVGTNLWINWAWIALSHRDEAGAARERDGQPTGNAELQASMVSIVASAFAIDGFATVVAEAGIRPARTEGWGRATWIWETLRANFEVGSKTQTWPGELKELWRLRSHPADGGLAHPKNIFGSPTTLSGQTTSPARATYTVETSTQTARLMGEIVSTCDVDALAPNASEALHQAVFDFRTFVAEFAERTGCTRPPASSAAR